MPNTQPPPQWIVDAAKQIANNSPLGHRDLLTDIIALCVRVDAERREADVASIEAMEVSCETERWYRAECAATIRTGGSKSQ